MRANNQLRGKQLSLLIGGKSFLKKTDISHIKDRAGSWSLSLSFDTSSFSFGFPPRLLLIYKKIKDTFNPALNKISWSAGT